MTPPCRQEEVVPGDQLGKEPDWSQEVVGRIDIMSFVLVGIFVLLVAKSKGGRVSAPEVFGPGQQLTKQT